MEMCCCSEYLEYISATGKGKDDSNNGNDGDSGDFDDGNNDDDNGDVDNDIDGIF